MVEYRLGELAELSGVSIRNIRAYRERGLLDPPRREGRSAFYDDRHLSQLGTINELLRKGYTSAHIAEFLASMRQGHDLADILGLQQAVFNSPGPATSTVDIDADGDEAQRLVHHGLAEVVDGRLTLVDPNIAEVVVAAEEPLRYVQTILRVADGVADQLDELAKSVAESLEESLQAGEGRGRAPRRGDEDGVRRLATDFRTLGRRVVTERLDNVLQRYLATAENH